MNLGERKKVLTRTWCMNGTTNQFVSTAGVEALCIQNIIPNIEDLGAAWGDILPGPEQYQTQA